MKTAVIIGANSDIAKSAMQLLQEQYHIVAIGRDTIDLDDPTSDMRIGMVLSMADADVIVNCAGVFGDNTLDYDTVFNVNLKSNWSVINYYIKNPPTKSVRFVMIGSSSYKQGRKNFILYSASKAALFNIWQGASEFVNDNLKLGLINISSPIARALIGKEEGDVAEVQAPGGVRRYEVVGVSYV